MGPRLIFMAETNGGGASKAQSIPGLPKVQIRIFFSSKTLVAWMEKLRFPVPGKHRNWYHFFVAFFLWGELENAGFRGFKLMEIDSNRLKLACWWLLDVTERKEVQGSMVNGSMG